MDGADTRITAVVRAVERGELSSDEALLAVDPVDVEALLHSQLADGGGGRGLAVGTPASPGAGVGHVWFTSDAAADAADRGDPVVLVCAETTPADIHGMAVAEAVVTTRGGLASHAAVVARGWGTPAVVGVDLQLEAHRFTAGDTVVGEGDVVSVDGSTGEIALGAAELADAAPPPELDTLLAWADQVRAGRLAVLANADNPTDAAQARRLGAEGIGLCRTEHLFLDSEGLAVLQRAMLASSPDDEAGALADLGAILRKVLVGVLAEMDGLPVTVRLLDAPQHEFLPSGSGSEHNPMLGTRGVRLGMLRPALYIAQVGAVVEAVEERVRAGGEPRARIMVPLTSLVGELAEARRWLSGAHIAVGTMIETPRAALVAGDLVAHADFLSFGTNDLTQLTYGFSRDDLAAELLPAYLAGGLLDDDPFATLDTAAVGSLIRTALEAARRARPDIGIGVCGEHGGDPRSIAWFVTAGFDEVSCSPYRVPVARLAAARALLTP